MQIELPHVVYLLQKTPLEKADVAVRSFVVDSAAKRVTVEVENTSDRFGRGLSAEVSADRESRSSGSFPLFPRSKRFVEVPWDVSGTPDRVVVRFADFSVDAKRPATTP